MSNESARVNQKRKLAPGKTKEGRANGAKEGAKRVKKVSCRIEDGEDKLDNRKTTMGAE